MTSDAEVDSGTRVLLVTVVMPVVGDVFEIDDVILVVLPVTTDVDGSGLFDDDGDVISVTFGSKQLTNRAAAVAVTSFDVVACSLITSMELQTGRTSSMSRQTMAERLTQVKFRCKPSTIALRSLSGVECRTTRNASTWTIFLSFDL